MLQIELITGWINLGVNPLSRITAGSVANLGYEAARVGEKYALPWGTAGVDSSKLAESGAEGIHFAEEEVLLIRWLRRIPEDGFA